MEISNQNYNYKPNFGSKKLANLLLRKGSDTTIPAELHKLLPEDKKMVNNLRHSLDWCQMNEGLCDMICLDFIEGLKTDLKDKYFLAIRQKDKVIAMCKAVLKDKRLEIDFISNINKDKDVKGAGTALIVKLVELAKQLGTEKCTEIRLSSMDEAFEFYEKLKFKRIWNSPYFMMPNDCFKKFLSLFKPKYFQE